MRQISMLFAVRDGWQTCFLSAATLREAGGIEVAARVALARLPLLSPAAARFASFGHFIITSITGWR